MRSPAALRLAAQARSPAWAATARRSLQVAAVVAVLALAAFKLRDDGEPLGVAHIKVHVSNTRVQTPSTGEPARRALPGAALDAEDAAAAAEDEKEELDDDEEEEVKEAAAGDDEEDGGDEGDGDEGDDDGDEPAAAPAPRRPAPPPARVPLTPGEGLGCISCSRLAKVLAPGRDVRRLPPCRWRQDVVLVAKTPSCVTAAAVARLERFLDPRRIHVVTTSAEKCAYYSAMSRRVRCVVESTVWAHLDYARLAALFRKHHSADAAVAAQWARRVGWYLQQLLKLGAAEYLGDALTEHFMVWDADMVPLAPEYPTCRDDATGRPRIVLELGGWRAPGYLATYRALFGEEMRHPRLGSFVGHRMVVRKARMLELLAELRGDPSDPRVSSWQERVVAAVDEGHMHTGFSEYATWGSWMVRRHAGEALVKPRVTWVRHLEWRPPPPPALCCPGDADFAAFSAARNHSATYVGVELGHVADPNFGDAYRQCHADDPRFEVAYGLDPPPGLAGGGGAQQQQQAVDEGDEEEGEEEEEGGEAGEEDAGGGGEDEDEDAGDADADGGDGE